MVTAEEVYASIASRENRLLEAARYIQELEGRVHELENELKKYRPKAADKKSA